MSGEEFKGRGRARGRGRGRGAAAPAPAPAPTPGPAPAAQQPQAAAPPQVGRGGRGRGRGRGVSAAPAPAQAAPAAPWAAAGGAPAPAAPADGSMPPMSGRGVTRGGARAEARPGASGDASAAAAMEKLDIGSSSVARRGTGKYYKSNDARFKCDVLLKADARSGAGHKDDAPAKFLVNYFRMTYKPDSEVFKYRVDFEPEVDNLRFRGFLVRKAVQGVCGEDVLFTFMTTEIFICSGNLSTHTVQTESGEQVSVKFSAKKSIPWTSPEIFVVLNSVFRKSMGTMGLTKIQRDFYNMRAKTTVSSGRGLAVDILPGYETAIGHFKDDTLLLNVSLTTRVLRQEKVADVIESGLRRAKGDPTQAFMDLKDELLGQVVLTRYNDKTYTISDIDFELTPESKFERKGAPISFVEYYSEFQKVTITNPKLRGMLVAKQSNRDKNRKIAQQTSSKPQDEGPVLLVPELCFMTGFTDHMRRDFELMKNITREANKEPFKMKKDLEIFINQLQEPSSESLKNLQGWGLKFEREMVEVDGRIMHQNSSGMNFGNQKNPLPFGGKDFIAPLRSQPVFGPQKLTSWLFVYTRGQRDEAEKFFRALRNAVKSMGIVIGDPVWAEAKSFTPSEFAGKIREQTGMSKDKYPFVLTLFDRENAAVYKAVKSLCYSQLGVASQVVTKRVAGKGMSVATKVGIQINCKLGGEMWRVFIPPAAKIMVCGYDTYHSGKGNNRKSNGVLVSSINPHLTQYHAQSFPNNPGEEMSLHLRTALTNALRKYKMFNGSYPGNIVVYRDGLGDGMLTAFADIELDPMLGVVQELCPESGFAVVIVKKRISTRILAKRGPNVDNPPPGAIIDGVITRPDWYDFYLVSQSARQGTVSPTHYNVVYDRTKLSARILQSLTYRLTHLYYNWTGAISVPAPCQYAHKLAFLCGDILNSQFTIDIADKLFYL